MGSLSEQQNSFLEEENLQKLDLSAGCVGAPAYEALSLCFHPAMWMVSAQLAPSCSSQIRS